MSKEPAALETEFGRFAAWTADVLAGRPASEAMAGASRGSGNPAALAWLADRLGIGPRSRVLDVGGGLGGPAAWLQRTRGAAVAVAEPMIEAAVGTRQLWPIPAVVAWAERLPFATGSFDAAWALGVLDTTDHKADLLTELHRVVAADGGAGLLSYEWAVPPDRRTEPPAANHFPTASELDRLAERCGWVVAERLDAADLPAPPSDWADISDEVADEVIARHDGNPVVAELEAQQDRMANLLATRAVAARLVHLRRT